MSSSNCCFLTCIQISQEAGKVVWYSHLFQNFPQLVAIHTVRGFGIDNKAKLDVFLEHGKTDWFQIRKGVHQGCILSPCLFNLHAEYIMRNAGLDEAQAVIKISGRNINNLRFTDDTTLMAESEELKSLLMKVKSESEKFALKLNMQKTKIMASDPITSCQIDGETMETETNYFLGHQNHCGW